jgi:hypothetical protein
VWAATGLAVAGLASGCSDDGATPVDLGTGAPSTTTTTAGQSPDQRPATPHAIGENPQARAYAEDQCRQHPEQAQGVIRIVDPSSNTVVGEVVVDCGEVRDEGNAPSSSTPSSP